MARSTEAEIGLAVMKVLAGEPDNEATVKTLIRKVPSHITLSADDKRPSPTREGEEIWEQIVRNIKSHYKSAGNLINSGYIAHIGRGRYKLTVAGATYLSSI